MNDFFMIFSFFPLLKIDLKVSAVESDFFYVKQFSPLVILSDQGNFLAFFLGMVQIGQSNNVFVCVSPFS